VAVYTWGDPSREPYVLLSHGWSSHATRFSNWIAPLRAAGLAVVGFDQLGHGQSSGKRTNLPEFAQVLAAVAKRHGEARAVIGHSLGGGAAALMLAEARLAERAILIAPVADPMGAASRFSQLVGLAEKLGRRLFDAYETEHRLPVVSLQAYRKVSAIAAPALIVHDLADRDVPWSDGECYARYWPQARLFSTSGLGHHRIVDDAVVIEASLRFLAGAQVGERVVSSLNLPFGIA
ncbi:MAG: alpha/beta fold hydrolase, partial [Gammaproteobacteria bacterium]